MPHTMELMEEHVGGPITLCSSQVLRDEGITFNVWGRKFRHAEERLKVLIDDFYIVREDIVLGPFPTHLGGTRLGRTRLGETKFTGHSQWSQEVSQEARGKHWQAQAKSHITSHFTVEFVPFSCTVIPAVYMRWQ
jgi:hypothetical protein